MENLDIASLLLRTVTGILFFFQGYDKIFMVKIPNVVLTFQDPIKKSFLPNILLKPLVILSSFTEMFGGLFLFFGLFKFCTLALLSVNLVFVAFSFSSIKAMWDMQYFIPRFAFVLILWVIPFSHDIYSLDKLFGITF